MVCHLEQLAMIAAVDVEHRHRKQQGHHAKHNSNDMRVIHHARNSIADALVGVYDHDFIRAHIHGHDTGIQRQTVQLKRKKLSLVFGQRLHKCVAQFFPQIGRPIHIVKALGLVGPGGGHDPPVAAEHRRRSNVADSVDGGENIRIGLGAHRAGQHAANLSRGIDRCGIADGVVSQDGVKERLGAEGGSLQRLLDGGFRFAVQCGGGFVQNKKRRVF